MFLKLLKTLFALSLVTGLNVIALSAEPNSDVKGPVGGVAILAVDSTVARVELFGKRQLLLANHAVIAIPLGTEISTHELDLFHHDDTQTTTHIEVTAKQYPEERITIENENLVTPPQQDLERIGRESKLMRDIYAQFSPQPANPKQITLPVQGRISGVFGARRIFNEKPRNPHSGLDLAAPLGTPILSPSDAVVGLTGNFFFNGNTVMLDHGGGYISMMCHLDEIRVKAGDEIQAGDIIGTVGSTGRSTGPHLHWSVSLSGDRVDPQDFMKKVNALFDAE